MSKPTVVVEPSGLGHRIVVDGKELSNVTDIMLRHAVGEPPEVGVTMFAADGFSFKGEGNVTVTIVAPPGYRLVATRRSETVTEYRVKPE